MNRRRTRYLVPTLFGGLLFPLLPVGCSGTEITEPAQTAAPAERVGSAASAVTPCAATFAPPVDYALNGSISAADVDGDGRIDLVVTSPSNGVSVALNQGNGTFAAPVHVAGGFPIMTVVADLNGDGLPDLAVADNFAGVNVLLNQGHGTFAAPASYQGPTYLGARVVAEADLNGDGFPDIVFQDSSGYTSVLLNHGDGTFAAAVDYAEGGYGNGSTTAIALGDLNGDGFPDIVDAEIHGFVRVLFNEGNGTFAAPVTYAVGGVPCGEPGTIAVVDLNGDGKPDVAYTDTGSGSVQVLLNQGNGTLAAPVGYPAGGNPLSFAVGDLNGDGFPDAVVGNYAGGGVSVLLNQGDGTFAAPVVVATEGNVGGVALADLNGDGKPDLAVTNSSYYYGDSASIFFNTTVCSADLCTAPCTALDACHVAGVCDPSTGVCSNPAAADGTACSDGHPCTVGDACESGACVAGPLSTTGACTPVTLTIQRAGASGSVFDTAIDAELPTTNNGSSESLPVGLVGGTAGKYRATLMSFDLSGLPASGAYVTSAVLTLYAYQSTGSQETFAHEVTVPWSGSTATWGNFPPGGYLAAVAATFPGVANVTAAAGVLEHTQADLTALVQAWYTGATPNHGILLEQNLPQNLMPGTPILTGVTDFCSSEWIGSSTSADGPTERPTLVVQYIPNY